MREVVSTKDAPQAIGPYSQAIKANGFVFTSGQIAIDPATQQVVAGDVAAQTDRVLRNVSEILKAGEKILGTLRKMNFIFRKNKDCPAFASKNHRQGLQPLTGFPYFCPPSLCGIPSHEPSFVTVLHC